MTAMWLVHDGGPLAPHDAWRAWSWEPGVVLALGVTALLYAVGSRRLAAGSRHRARTRRLEAGAFWAGWLTLAVALVSPLHAMGGALLWAHMAQHELLMVVAAPLLVLGRPFLHSFWALGRAERRRIGRVVGRLRPVARRLGRIEIAWALHATALLVWHVPALYDRTVASELVHALQHASFLGSALVFWWSVLGEARLRSRHGAAVLSLFTTATYTGGLGALLTVSGTVWYRAYGAAAPLWGLTALEDQQLAGLIMWVPAGASYLVATLWLVVRWLQESERRVLRRERLRQVAAALPLLLLVLAACESDTALSAAEANQITGGNAARGRVAFRQYGCGTCHTAAGVPGADGLVGPPLDGVGARAYVAGVLTNSPSNLERWIQAPRDIDSLTAMPNLGVTPSDARDLAAFLYTLPR